MQENRYDGSQVTTAGATNMQIQEALANPANSSIEVHRPGSIVEVEGVKHVVQADGTLVVLKHPHAHAGKRMRSRSGAEYQVQGDGSYRRTNKPLSKKARRRLQARRNS